MIFKIVKIIDDLSGRAYGFTTCTDYTIEHNGRDKEEITLYVPGFKRDIERTVKMDLDDRHNFTMKDAYTPESLRPFAGFRPWNYYPPKKVIFNNPATIVIWKDGTKTVVKKQKGDRYDKEKGLALCYMKKMLGNTSRALNDALEAAYETD